jgi:tRNA threonylcarbamoyladenosine biosynthesis protein TsaE
MEYTYVSKSEADTESFGQRLAEKLNGNAVIALDGDLGAGKTVLARGIARGLGVPGDILSPTFTLLRTYEGRLSLNHFDVYRISDEDELTEIGFEDVIYGGGVSVVEWAQKIPRLLPASKISILLQRTDKEEERMIKVRGPAQWDDALKAAVC